MRRGKASWTVSSGGSGACPCDTDTLPEAENNPCLIGEPGVGKTAIAEALAIRIATGQVPYKLRGKEVWLVDLTALVAGTQFRGQFETRILGLLNEVKSEGNVIL